MRSKIQKPENGKARLYTQDVAEILGVAFHTVRYFIDTKQLIPTRKIGKFVVFDLKDVLAFKEERKKKGALKKSKEKNGTKTLEECQKKYLSQKQVAEILGLSFRTVRALVDGKQLDYAEIACQKKFFEQGVVADFKKKREKQLIERAIRIKKRKEDKAKKSKRYHEALKKKRKKQKAERLAKLKAKTEALKRSKTVVSKKDFSKLVATKEKPLPQKELFSLPPKLFVIKEICSLPPKKPVVSKLSTSKTKERTKWNRINQRTIVRDPYYMRKVDFDYEIYQDNKTIQELEKTLQNIKGKDVSMRKLARLKLIKAVGKRRKKLAFLQATNFQSYKNTIEKIGVQE